jgi:hypothetical protein
VGANASSDRERVGMTANGSGDSERVGMTANGTGDSERVGMTANGFVMAANGFGWPRMEASG